MLNPFNPEQNSDPSGLLAGLRLQKRLLQNIHTARVDVQIFEIVQDAFEEALKKEQLVVMPDIAKKYLLAKLMKQVLMEMVTKLTNSKAV